MLGDRVAVVNLIDVCASSGLFGKDGAGKDGLPIAGLAPDAATCLADMPGLRAASLGICG